VATTLDYRPMTLEQIEAFPEGTVLALTWGHDPEPELFRCQPSAREPRWGMLTSAAAEYGEWERWSDSEVHSEHALYAVIYTPEAGQ